MHDHLGSIPAGRQADVPVLEKDPLEEIENITTHWLAVQRGKVVYRHARWLAFTVIDLQWEKPSMTRRRIGYFSVSTPLLLLLLLASGGVAGDGQGLESDLAALTAYRSGRNPAVLRRIERSVAEASQNTQVRATLERGLIEVLGSGNATPEARRFACRQLGIIGTDASVPALASLLGDENLCEDARFGLERIPGPVAAAALLDALPDLDGKALIGVIHSLAARRVAAAVGPLTALLASRNTRLCGAAAAALGRIGVAGLEPLLEAGRHNTPVPPEALQAAILDGARELTESGDADRAEAIYEQLQREGVAPAIRRAAFLGALRTRERRVEDLALRPLRSGDTELADEALAFLAGGGPEEADPEALRRRVVQDLAAFPRAIRPRLEETLLSCGRNDPGLLAELARTAADPEIRRHALPSLLEIRRSTWTNLAPGAKVDSPDGLEKDGDAGGDAAAIDGDPATYWDETDSQPHYGLRIDFDTPHTISALRITGWKHHQFAPRDFTVTADEVPVKVVRDARYTANVLWVFVPATTCRSLALHITGYYGRSPAIRELAVYDAATTAAVAGLMQGLADRHCTLRGVIPDAELDKIIAAAPDRARAMPKHKRKLLVFSLAFGYKHSSIPYGKAAMDVLAAKTGAFDATFSDDPSSFEAQNLAGFDAVLLNSTNNEVFLPEDFEQLGGEARKKAIERDARLKANLADFVSRGGGLAVIHAGVATFRKWPEFGKIMGARFDNHPWYAGSTVVLRVEDPDHPVAQAFVEAPNLEITDEIYQLEQFSLDDIRVLLRVDLEKTHVAEAQRKLFHREDGIFPISFVKSYGKGRVFYCALGHQHEIFWNPVALQHYLDGIQFVLGDLDGAATPKSPALHTGKPGFKWQESEQGIALLHDGKPVWRLVLDKKLDKAYIHPLGLLDGTPLTWLSPPDHPWHRALWFSWKVINGVNYWEYAKEMGRTRMTFSQIEPAGGFSAKAVIRLEWHPPNGEAVLNEVRRLHVTAPDEAGRYAVDWNEEFTALRDAVLDRTPPPGKDGGKSYGGYAGLSLRLAKETADWRIEDSEGRKGMDCHGQPARWITCSLRIARSMQHTEAQRKAELAILYHPANRRYPTPSFVVLQENVPFVYLGPALLFDEPLTLKKGESLVLRYRILVLPDPVDRTSIESEWREFAGR